MAARPIGREKESRLSPQQWSRLEELFERGSDQPDSVQEQILAECADDRQIQAELQTLWQHENADPGFLAHLPNFEVPASQGRLSPDDSIAGRFTILERIGQGGMGEVYRALDERLQRIVAIKIVSAQLAADETYRKRLEQEARAVSSLSDPAICALHDLGSDGDLLFLVMEYVHGEALDVRLSRGAIPEKEAISIALAICSGLQHAHANRLIHRDLKPANVMLTAHGVKLLDFGIACRTGTSDADGKIHSGENNRTATATGQVVGTPAYMSPEQAAGRPVDARSDLYSLGVLLWEMIEPGAYRNSGAAPPHSLRTIVERCLNPDPARRFSSAGELAKALQNKSRSPLSGKRILIATAAVACTLTAFLYWLRTAHDPGEPNLRVLTSYPGTEYFPTISPDGNSFAFLWNGEENNYDLYVRPIDSDSPKRLTTDPLPESSPKWSPDGRWIAFVRNGKAMLISPSGGSERFLIRIDPTKGFSCDVSLAWSADSKRLIFPRAPVQGQQLLLHDIDIETGHIRQLSQPRLGSAGQVCPEASPDGRKLLFQSLELGQPRVLLANLDSEGNMGSVRELTEVDGWSHTWTPDNAELIFTRNRPGPAFLFRSAVGPKDTPRRLPFGEEGMYPTMSRTGGRLVYMRRRLDVHIWRAQLQGTTGFKRLQPELFLPSSQPDNSPEYSPDGSRIAFFSDRGGKSEIWVSDPGGRNLKRLAEGDSLNSPPRWSPDGKSLVYSFRGDVYRINVEGDPKPQGLVTGEAVDNAPSYSRDGRWLYFTSHRTGRAEVWRMPAKGGTAHQLTQVGAYMALESAGGSYMLILRRENGKDYLYTLPISGGAMRRISEVPMRPTLWVVANGFYFIAATSSDEFPTLSYYDEISRKIRIIAQVPHKQRSLATGLTATADAKQFLYSTYDLQADLMLVENYR